MLKPWGVVSLSLVMALLLAACDGRGSKIRQLSDHDLAERYGYCLDRKPTAPGKAQACENLRRECERRKEEIGSYICRHR
jgi:hypothetical protein